VLQDGNGRRILTAIPTAVLNSEKQQNIRTEKKREKTVRAALRMKERGKIALPSKGGKQTRDGGMHCDDLGRGRRKSDPWFRGGKRKRSHAHPDCGAGIREQTEKNPLRIKRQRKMGRGGSTTGDVDGGHTKRARRKKKPSDSKTQQGRCLQAGAGRSKLWSMQRH